MLGIVTVDDILDVAEEEATEDIQLGVAVNPLESTYSSTLPIELFRKRIGWLLILILVNLISAAVISNYEEHLLEYITLALFMPLVIASGGIVGLNRLRSWFEPSQQAICNHVIGYQPCLKKYWLVFSWG